MEEEALALLGKLALVELGLGGPGPVPAHPEPPGSPLHLPDRACADRGGGAGGRHPRCAPRHQHLPGAHPGGRARGLLGARLQQIGRGLPQGGSHQAVHPAIGRLCDHTASLLGSQWIAENLRTKLRLANTTKIVIEWNWAEIARPHIKVFRVNLTDDFRSFSKAFDQWKATKHY